MKAADKSKATVRTRKGVITKAASGAFPPSQGRSYTATEAKNEFGRVLDETLRGATVIITKHDAPKAVLMSIEAFNALRQAPQLRLDTLSSEFDALLAQMQSSDARAAMERAFHASPAELGKAAIAAARKRG